jgi:hypothetical protein
MLTFKNTESLNTFLSENNNINIVSMSPFIFDDEVYTLGVVSSNSFVFINDEKDNSIIFIQNDNSISISFKAL